MAGAGAVRALSDLQPDQRLFGRDARLERRRIPPFSMPAHKQRSGPGLFRPLVYSSAFLGIIELGRYRADKSPSEKELLLPVTFWIKPDTVFVNFFQSAEPLSLDMACVNLHPYRAPYKWSNHFRLPRRCGT